MKTQLILLIANGYSFNRQNISEGVKGKMVELMRTDTNISSKGEKKGLQRIFS